MCCSELYYFPETYVGNGKKVLVVPMTRKSYTTEVRMAIDKVRSYPGVKSLAITCDADSSKYNDYMLLSPETPEDSVIMTRSFTSMIYLAVVMSYYVGGKKEKIEQLKDYAANAESFLKATDEMAKKIVAEHPECNLFITLGQGINYGIANECMNKMKEMSLSNSEAYYTLEYRHGPMSLVDDKTLIILLGNEGTVDGDAKLLTQMKEYGAKVLAIGNNASKDFTDVDYTLDMPYGYDSLQNAPIIGYIGQLIGYYVAELKNLNADSPRHLTQAIVIK
jgi:glucosamine--fructose-6-phosphate aminotransferase (isomerizing)